MIDRAPYTYCPPRLSILLLKILLILLLIVGKNTMNSLDFSKAFMFFQCRTAINHGRRVPQQQPWYPPLEEGPLLSQPAIQVLLVVIVILHIIEGKVVIAGFLHNFFYLRNFAPTPVLLPLRFRPYLVLTSSSSSKTPLIYLPFLFP